MGTINNPIVKKYCRQNQLELTAKNPGNEGYVLHVNNNLIFIGGWDDAGAFFGLQSLRQLIDAGKGKKIGGINVLDWPSFPFRAIKVCLDNIAFLNAFERFYEAIQV